MTALLTADIHLTTNPREEERWGLLPWLGRQAKPGTEIGILGDLTEAKDRHPAQLVNRLVEQIMGLAKTHPVVILKGNHDAYDMDHPFFGFLAKLPSNSGVTFITTPTELTLSIGTVLALPATEHWEEEWANIDFSHFDYAFAHQTFEGVVGENGFKIPGGLPAGILDGVKSRAFSGDIHSRQRFGTKGEYVGAPYRIDFGDTYEPRCLMVSRASGGQHQQQDLVFPTKGKYVVKTRDISRLSTFNVPKGAEVKIRIVVSRAELPEWKTTKANAIREAEALGLLVKDVELVRMDDPDASEEAIPKVRAAASPPAIYREYCMAKNAPEGVLEAGLAILEDKA